MQNYVDRDRSFLNIAPVRAVQPGARLGAQFPSYYAGQKCQPATHQAYATRKSQSCRTTLSSELWTSRLPL